MFAPPKELKPEIWSVIPEEFRAKEPSEWVRVKLHGQMLDSFLEGPAFDRDGNLYVVDIPYGRIFCISPEKKWRVVAQYGGEPNGIAIRKDGEIFIADHEIGIMHLDPVSGEVVPYCTRYDFEQFKGTNDLFFASNGDLYFTDQGSTGLHDPSGRVFRMKPDGRLDMVLRNVPSPNGLVLNLKENTLLVAATRANAIWRAPMHPDTGNAFKVGVFIQLSGSTMAGPDGMALDAQGGLAIAHPGLSTVWVFTEEGEPLYRIRTNGIGKKPSNVAYGGPGNKSLYITESDSGSILRVELPVAGNTLYSHM